MKRLFFGILPFVILLAACSKDGKGIDDGGKEPGKVETKELNLSFDVVMPNPANPNSNQKSSSTYALSDIDENNVAVIDVLAFLENGANMEFAEWAKVSGTSISDNGSVSKKKFKVNFTKLVQSPAHKYQFVVIANGRGPVQSLFTGAGAITTGALKDAAMARLKLEGVAGWVSNPTGGGYLHTPMWGEGDATVVTTGLAISDIKLLRMLAKINVTIDPNTGVRSKFLLKSIDLYNYNKDGRVVPDAANLASPSKSKVDEPTNIGVHTEGPVQYAATSTTEMVEEIYTFESKVPYVGLPPAVNLNDVICIVIGGEFDTDGRTTYYRVDLAKKNAQGKYDYMNILRNHGYNINVTNVAGSGYESSIKAFKARAINIEVDIEAWDESDINISYDGQYQFGTNKNKLSFFAEGREQTLLVFADHPSGWEIESKPAWITIDPMSDNSASTKEIKVTATAWAGPGDRVDEFIIKAGNIRKPIKVEQSSDPELSLSVTPAGVLFRKSGSQAKSISITKFPLNTPVTITVTGNIVWAAGESPEVYSGFDITSFSFRPEVNNTGTSLNSTITISVSEGSSIKSEVINVTQFTTDELFDITFNTMYEAEGGQKKFQVESSLPWQLSKDLISDPSNIITLLTTAEQPKATNPVDYKFNLSANTTYGERMASFYAKSSDLDFNPQMITIKQTYKPLYLNLNTSTVAFGLTAGAKSVTVTTNAGWIVSSISNTSVLSTTTPSIPVVNVEQAGSVSALVDASGTVSLTPRTDYVTFGAAGTTLSSVVTVQSRNHTEVAIPISKTVTVSRTVPSVFSVASITPTTVAIGGGNVTANTVASNAAWTLSSNLTGTTPYPHTAAEFNTINKAIYIPANTTAWTGARTLTVSVASTGHTTKAITVTQPGYIFSYSSGFPTATIPQAGGTYNVIFKSASFSPAVYVRMLSGTTVVSTSKVVPAITTANGTQTVSMAVNAAWAGNRTVTLQWSKDNSTWAAFSPNIAVAQTGYYLPTITVSPILNTAIAYTSQTYTVKATAGGYYPAIPIQILINNVLHKSGSIPAASLNSSASLILDSNTTTANRAILVQYKNPQTGTWTTVTNGLGTQRAPEGLDLGTFWVMYPSKLPTTPMNLSGATAHCTGLGTGWRLPTYESPDYEIAMVRNTVFMNAYTPVLNADPMPLEDVYTTAYYFWSSTEFTEPGVIHTSRPRRQIKWVRSTNTYEYFLHHQIDFLKYGRPICVKSK